jgi:prolyl-tRNA editing enzyme YbaK/EbsC (Cys-tRNA(Pro) deacylase)
MEVLHVQHKTFVFDQEQGLECCLVDPLLLMEQTPIRAPIPSSTNDTTHTKKAITSTLENGDNYDFYNVDLMHKTKRTKRFFQRIWKRVLKKVMREGDKTSDSSTAGTNSTSSISIHTSFGSEDGGEIEIEVEMEAPLIQTRLLRSGVIDSIYDIEFVQDTVSKEIVVDHLYANSISQAQNPDGKHMGVSHVKTGIWRVTYLKEDGQDLTTFYIVTGVSMDDRVDTKKLRKAIFAGQSFARRPKLVMAPKKVAEALTGFKSGTMAPICHSVDMKLFMEKSLFEGVDLSAHRFNVGSGMFGKCLSVSAETFLRVAHTSSKGMELCSIVQKKKHVVSG